MDSFSFNFKLLVVKAMLRFSIDTEFFFLIRFNIGRLSISFLSGFSLPNLIIYRLFIRWLGCCQVTCRMLSLAGSFSSNSSCALQIVVAIVQIDKIFSARTILHSSVHPFIRLRSCPFNSLYILSPWEIGLRVEKYKPFLQLMNCVQISCENCCGERFNFHSLFGDACLCKLPQHL